MTNTTPEAAVMKVDVLGRVQTPAARREALLDELERSGLRGTEFARLAGVKYQTLASWAQKRRKARGQYPSKGRKPTPEAAGGSLRLVEAVVASGSLKEAGGGGVPLCVQLPGGARVEVHDARQAVLAAELLRALAARSC